MSGPQIQKLHIVSSGGEWPKISRKTKLPLSNNPKNLAVAVDIVGLTFKFDKFSHQIFMSERGADFTPLSDANLRDAYWAVCGVEIDGVGLAPSRATFDDYVRWLAGQAAYHPVRDYIAKLHWDGEPRIDTWLTRYCKVEESTYSRAVGRKILVAGIARIFEPGVKFDHALIIEGPQGVGKSSVPRILAGAERYCDTLTLGADAKTTMELLSGVWIAEFSEMEGAGKREIETIKSQLSHQVDRARLSYGREVTSRPRQAIFMGTINPRGAGAYLRDPTGGRRFWPVSVPEAIDLEGLARDRDQLWAEADEAYREGELLFLTGAELDAAQEQQAARTESHPWLEILEPLLEGLHGKIAGADIYRILGFDEAAKIEQRTKTVISEIMGKLGWGRSKRLRVPGSEDRPYGYEKIREDGSSPWMARESLISARDRVHGRPSHAR